MAYLAELSSLDATALADLVRSRSVSPLELLEATIARIEQINPSLNAIVTSLYDQARAAAAQPVSGPFGGVPIGTHFVGRFGDEATLFGLAAQLEAARPWAHRRPPIGR